MYSAVTILVQCLTNVIMYLQGVLFISVLTGFCTINVSSMTRQQLKKSTQLMKKSCMPKNDVTEDQVGEIEQGKFIEEHNVMCYIACIYTMGGLIKNNKMVFEGMVKQVDMMFPPDMKTAVKAAINGCTGVAKQYKEDICKAAYWSAKCMYDADPDNFLFP